MNISNHERQTVTALEQDVIAMGDAFADFDPIVSAAQGRHLVLIGEATHGTAEFYRLRAELSMRLIAELGFDAIAVEADWPDACGINRFVSGDPASRTATDTLRQFERFPTWMWANTEVLHFIRWLKAFNEEAVSGGKRTRPVGFYGLDLYSMSTSASAVIDYLAARDPAAAQRARKRYGCLDQFMHHPQGYGRAAELGLTPMCEHEIMAQLIELRHKAYRYITQEGLVDGDEYFCAEQNAKLVRNAETYYRTMFRGRPNSWNVRDQHIFETLGDLSRHLSERLGRDARLIVWAHNSHVGNAAATEMKRRGEFNIGQLVRESHGDDALLVGFSTCHGEVTAASDWDRPAERKRVRPPFEGSYERLFHHVSHKAFMLDLKADTAAVDHLLEPRLMRAIGVVYRPDTERQSHYFLSCLPEQFDWLIHLDRTSALEPLEIPMVWHKGELDETYPTGL